MNLYFSSTTHQVFATLFYFILSLVPKQLRLLCNIIYYRLFPLEMNRSLENPKGLIILLHGLLSFPETWNPLILQLQTLDKYDDYEIVAPIIHKRGNCSLAETSEPVKNMIDDWLSTHRNQEIILIGASNGARIASELECHLATKATVSQVKSITLVSIAGVHNGTYLMDLLNRYGLTRFLPHCPEIIAEFAHSSSIAKDLLTRWSISLDILESKGITSKHLFLTTIHDDRVWNSHEHVDTFIAGWPSSQQVDHIVYVDGITHTTITNHCINDVIGFLSRT